VSEVEKSFIRERIRIERVYALRQMHRTMSFFSYEDKAHFWRIRERYSATLELLQEAGFDPLAQVRILDVGCGDGRLLREFIQWGADPRLLSGIDLRLDAIQKARRLLPGVELRCGCASDLPWGERTFDVVVLSTVLSSVLDREMRSRIAEECGRVLSAGGVILWYDFLFDNPKNPEVRGIPVREVRELFRDYEIRGRRITLAPFIARRISRVGGEGLYRVVAWIPVLRTHWLALLRRRVAA